MFSRCIKSTALFSSALTIIVSIGGCAVNDRYHWGNYESSLFDYYKHPENAEKFAIALEKTIRKGEAKGKVPPGLYAELGYMKYQSGEYGLAIELFKKEKGLWPDSSALMDAMILAATNAGRTKGSSK